jgi:hypothetical protein
MLADSESTDVVSIEDQEDDDANDETLVTSAPTTPCDPDGPAPRTPDKVAPLSCLSLSPHFAFLSVLDFICLGLKKNWMGVGGGLYSTHIHSFLYIQMHRGNSPED